MTDWIPITERLPEIGDDVLVTYDYKDNRYVYMSYYYSGGFMGSE